MKKHYLYAHTRNDTGAIFYIGIGTQYQTSRYMRAKSISNRNPHWGHIVAKHGRTVHILCESDNYDYIKQKEVLHIKYYGKENLCNITDGGDGMVGLKHTLEARIKIGAAHKGKKVSAKSIAKTRAAKIGKKLPSLSPEHKAKISAANKGRKYSYESRIKISESLKGRILSHEHRSNMSAAHIGKKRLPHSPETRAKISAGQKLRHSLSRSKLSMTKYYMKFCPIINGKPQPDVETEHSSHSQSKTAMLDQATSLVKSGFKIIRSKGHAITLVNGDTEIRLLTYERKDNVLTKSDLH